MQDQALATLELIEPVECFWKPHIAVQVDSMYEGVSHFEIRREAKDDKDAAVQYVQDPWGNWIELVEVKK